MSDDTVVVFSGPWIDARLVCSHLEGHGVPAILLGEVLGQGLPHLTPGGTGTVAVGVPRAEEARALEVLAARPDPAESDSA